MALQFGYYPHPLDSCMGDIAIRTLPDLDLAVHEVAECEHVSAGWLVVPKGSRVFALPKTHEIDHATDADPERLAFLVQCLGFFMGMRLSSTEAGFLDATPVVARRMTDCSCSATDRDRALVGADRFWDRHRANRRIAKALAGVIHSLFLAERPHLLGYERFLWLYTALEGCHFVRCGLDGEKPMATPHDRRIKVLCERFQTRASRSGRVVPDWANPANSADAGIQSVAGLRNAMIHEGLFFDEPLGFAAPSRAQDRDVPRQMAALVCRLVVALLGLDARTYIEAPLTSRSPHRLEVA